MVVNPPGEAVTIQFRVSTAVDQDCSNAETAAQTEAEAQEEQEIAAQATDEEVMQLAAEEYPETLMGANRPLAAWRALWTMDILTDAQVESRWGLDQLHDFMRELARAKAESDSQHLLETELRATRMDRDQAEGQGRDNGDGEGSDQVDQGTEESEIPPGQPDRDTVAQQGSEESEESEELERESSSTARPGREDGNDRLPPAVLPGGPPLPADVPDPAAERGCGDGSSRAEEHDSAGADSQAHRHEGL